MAKYRSLFLLSVVLLASMSCKKFPLPQQPGQGLMEFHTVELDLAYGHPVVLNITGKSNSSIIFDTELVELNDVGHILFTVRGSSQSGHKIIVTNQEFEPYGGFWTSALTEGFTIYGQATGQRRWTAPHEAGILLAIADNGNTIEYKGTWKEKHDRYIGISVQMEDGIHYGWVSVSHQAHQKQLRVHSWAFCKIADHAVKAGKY